MTTAEDNQKPTRSRRPRWVRWSRDLILIVVVLGAIQWWQSRGLAHGKAVPLAGMRVDGSPLQVDYRDGPVLVHFWASWCPICRVEQDTIDAIAVDRAVITVATTSGTADEVAAYLGEHGLRMPVLMDERGDIARSWGVRGVPATFIVDRSGAIRHAGMGYSTGLGLRLRLWLAGL
ncbi:MAG: TlpA family protein disulfide reductase [Gammaproteobacteria bacterium]|nr:TlpA family protein disulfide reductase [Gammaproteobacteria bacterium]